MPADNYPTPSWCVERLLESVALPGGTWLEPAVGEGAILRAVNRDDVSWTAVDIRPEAVKTVSTLVPSDRLFEGDFLTLSAARTFEPRSFSVVLTNPPYGRALEFVQASLPLAETVVMLLRLSFLASKTRHDFMKTTKPDVWVMPTRPAFVNRKTDSTDYAWFIWRTVPPTDAKIRWLPPKT